jgi:large subunit ribosomal protein L17
MKRGNQRKFGLKRDERKALMKSLATALIDQGKIRTTRAKAKTLSSFADRLVTKAKKATIASRRDLLSDVGAKAVEKLVKEIAPRFTDRAGGYTRVIRMDRRKSDGSEMAIIEFVN